MNSNVMDNVFESNNIIELLKKLSKAGVPEGKYKEYIDHYLDFKARKYAIPLHGRFELTPLCNLDCKMCYVHLNNEQFNKNDLLPVSTWKELISQAHEMGMRYATLTGGECLTYPAFDDLYLDLYNKGIIPGIMSNGLLIDEERLNFFEKHPPRMIQITIYGSSDDAYEKVTGKRVFSIIYRNLRMLKKTRVPIKLSITPNEYMRDDSSQIIDKLEELGIPYNINANLIPPRRNTGRTVEDLTVDEYVDLYKYRNRFIRENLNPIDPEELPDENHDSNAVLGLTCGAGRSSFSIKYDGTMCPCLSLDEIVSEPLKIGFGKAWNQINSLAKSFPLPVECGNCIYYDRCLRCAAMHKNAPTPGHCDPRICERTKKMIIAGFIPLPINNKI